MSTMGILIGMIGIFLQILVAVNKILRDKNFDLKYWWLKNKVATIVALIATIGGSYVMTQQGYDVDTSVGIVVNLVLGYITSSMTHSTLRVKSEKVK